MKRWKLASALVAMSLLFAACGSQGGATAESSAPAAGSEAGGAQETLMGQADGKMGVVKVEVVREGETIKSVTVTENKETEDIAKTVLTSVPAAIVEANSADVDLSKIDGTSGATVTSNAIISAVKNALDPAANPYPAETEESKAPEEQSASGLSHGLGVTTIARKGPGEDDQKVPVYSWSEVYAGAVFDQDGKILDLDLDILEVATPNYDGEGMPQMVGLPGTSYNNDGDHDGKVEGTIESTEESFISDVAEWKTKRERGESYMLNSGTWAEEATAFENLFVGKTVEEVQSWFDTYTNAAGRPLTAEQKDEKDQAKYDALSEEDKKMLMDVTSSATMSLKDGHGDIIGAIVEAYETRRPIEAKEIAFEGLGEVSNARKGPGKDDKDVQVWSFNNTIVHTLFDKDDKIVAIYTDVMEVATPNYDGASMPHFAGWPGQGGYNYDENHDGKVDGTMGDTVDEYIKNTSEWMTKRERGADYVLNSGTWAEEADTFEKLFVGKTVQEVQAWFDAYTNSKGRPLMAEEKEAADQEKYNALSDDDKKMLADVTSSATMSLEDGHSLMLSAIMESFTNKMPVAISVK